MKKGEVILISCMILALGLGLAVTNAEATPLGLNTTLPSYVGYFTPDHPAANETQEAARIQHLIELAAGASDTNYLGQDYYRSSNLFSPTSVNFNTHVRYDTEIPVFGDLGLSGPVYILAKYDAGNAGARVWLLNDATVLSGGFIVPTNWNGQQYGLSHLTVFGGTPVPEPATLLLLGSGMVGLVALRRRFRK